MEWLTKVRLFYRPIGKGVGSQCCVQLASQDTFLGLTCY